jgi:hypothetical protein
MEDYVKVACVKTTKKHFEIFKKHCLVLQAKWGLSSWELYFYHTDLDGCYARMTSDQEGRLVRIEFNTSWPEETISIDGIKNVAKHEMIHLVLARLYTIGLDRFASSSELDEANEEAVRILEKIV